MAEAAIRDLVPHRPRVAVIGYGYAGRSFHSYLVGLTPGLELYGVASRDPATRQKIVAERGCRAFESFDQVLDDPTVDLVVLATPHDTHAPLAIRAMQAGKHVVTDKVMCLNLAEAERMIDTAHRTGKLLTVFHNRRWDNDFLTLKKAIGDGQLGSMRWIEMAWQRYGVPSTDRWRGRRESGGGKIYDLGAHMLDQLLLLIQSPIRSVYARVQREWEHTDVESQAQVTVAFEDGTTGIVDVGAMSRIPKPRMLAIGTGATFIRYGVDPQETAMKQGDIDAAREDPANYPRINNGTDEQVLEPVAGRWRSFYENVADVLTRGAAPAVTLPEMRRLMATLDAIFESERAGQATTPKVK